MSLAKCTIRFVSLFAVQMVPITALVNRAVQTCSPSHTGFCFPFRMEKRNTGGVHRACVVVLLSLLTALAAPAQKLTPFYVFHGPDGANPVGPLVQGFDGNFYGNTARGGSQGFTGTLFSLTPKRVLTTLYSFCSIGNCSTGSEPNAGLLQSSDGNIYGTTPGGGNPPTITGPGTLFKISPTGAPIILYDFCAQTGCTDGSYPVGELVQGADNNLYGVTALGGTGNSSNCDNSGCGTVFKISPTGALTTLHSFCPQAGCSDGSFPGSGLIQATDGNFYGTTTRGGTIGGTVYGATIYKITPQGAFTVLYSFCTVLPCADGGGSGARLVQGSDGNLYGTTFGGGAFNSGTIFKVSTTGAFTTLYSFCAQSGCPDGEFPYDGLIQATDGNFYGTTTKGATNGTGTLFRITPGGALTTLISFAKGDPAQLKALYQATDGILYMSDFSGNGSIRTLSLGLAPFVETLPTSGKVGTMAVILGTNLTGASAVEFNGTAAKFTVVSASEIKAKVPTGATTGIVEVTTPSGTLKSNVAFQIP